MKKLVFIFCFLTIFLFYSCLPENTETEKKLMKCVNKNINGDLDSSNRYVDFYELTMQIEKELIDGGFISNNKKKSYFDFLRKINKNKSNDEYFKLYIKKMKIIHNAGFEFNSFIIIDNIFNHCPYNSSISSKKGKKSPIYLQGEVYSKLMKENFDNEILLEELSDKINDEDFNKIVYRAPVILLVIIKLDNNFNTDLEEYKNEIKGKKFL